MPRSPALLALLCSPALACDPVGSPTIDRPLDDSSVGVVLIYRGAGPVAGPGVVSGWRYFDNNDSGSPVTPLLFRREGDTFVLVGVGTSRTSDGSGVQSHPFGLIAGTDQLAPGSGYALGFTTRAFTPGPGPGQITQTGASSGVIDFTGYNDFTDPWDYALTPAVELGQVYGPGGDVPLNGAGFPGRIYSAEFLLNCDDACPADLAAPFGILNIFDIQTFIGLYNAQDPAADLAAPFGAFNIFDLQQYINIYNQGCP